MIEQMDQIFKVDTRQLVKTTKQVTANPDLYVYDKNKLLLYAKGELTYDEDVWMQVMAVAFIILEIIGTVGALLTIFTMIQGNTFLITYRVYLSIIALTDAVLLFVIGGNMAVLTFTGYNPVYMVLLQSDISCRAFHVLLGFIYHFALWLHIALMIEPYVMAVFPKKLNSISSHERAHYLTLLLLTVFIIVNMNYFWTIKRQKEPLGLEPHELCYFESSFEQFETQIYPVIDCALTGVLPMLIWLCLLIYTAIKYCIQGDHRPGGLLISTGEYIKISYSVSTLYLAGHLPRFIWLISKFLQYSSEAELNPGISTLQNFHTELIDGDPKINLVFAAAIALRIFVLMASKSFRMQLWVGIIKVVTCCRKSRQLTKTGGNKGVVQGLKMALSAGTPLITHSESVISSRVALNGQRYA